MRNLRYHSEANQKKFSGPNNSDNQGTARGKGQKPLSKKGTGGTAQGGARTIKTAVLRKVTKNPKNRLWEKP